MQALAVGGRICVIGVSAGVKAELNLLALMGKRARIYGSTLRARSLEEKALAARLLEREVLPLFEADEAAGFEAVRHCRDFRATGCRRGLRSSSPQAASSARSCSPFDRQLLRQGRAHHLGGVTQSSVVPPAG